LPALVDTLDNRTASTMPAASVPLRMRDMTLPLLDDGHADRRGHGERCSHE
jgi:hypothetical protein